MKVKSAVEIYKEVLLGKRKHFPNNFWKYGETVNYSNAKEVTIYMIENVLFWDEDEVKEKLCFSIFKENKLYGMLTAVFNNSIYDALNNAYPGKYHEWEFASVPRNYWNLETAKKAIIWLVEEKLKWSENDIKEKMCNRVFRENGLYGMLTLLFNNSTYEALNTVYPKKYHEWEIIRVPQNYWNLDTAKKATIWLIKEKLGYTEKEAKQKISLDDFKKNGLYGMLQTVFKGSVASAIENVYRK